MNAYYPSKHAVHAMSTRDVAWSEVLWVLTAPEVTYLNPDSYAHRLRSQVSQRGKLYVVTSMTPTFDRFDTSKLTPLHAVITVGLRSEQQWNNQDVRSRHA